MQRVRDILERKGSHVYGIHPDATVFNAISIMAEKHIGALLVTEANRPVGIISERDYMSKVILKDKSSKDTQVADIMTQDLVTVTPDAQIDECMSLMRTHHIRHLPVLEEGQMVGLISQRDLFSAIIDEQAHTIEHLEHYVRGEV